ncbi:MAG TPA: hypothetical protein VKP65_10245 [Rhodothermales bacterium]|nr:hypothetical protein [Rhodothermales bacterium]
MQSNTAMDPAMVCNEMRRVKTLLTVLESDFEAAEAMPWTLFTLRVDALIEEIEKTLHTIRPHAPDELHRPLRRRLRACMHARLKGPYNLINLDKAS